MFLTLKELKEKSRYADKFVKLSDGILQGYVERADIWIVTRTHCDYDKVTKDVTVKKLKIATLKLVDYLYSVDQSKVIESRLQGIQSEQTLDYSYSLKGSAGNPKYGTGDMELDLLLDSLTLKLKGLAYFKTSRQSKKTGQGSAAYGVH